MPPFIVIVAFVALLFGVHDLWAEREIHRPPGVLAPDDPDQRPLSSAMTAFAHRGWELTPQAEFRIEARVLGKERYRWDTGAKLSPIDLAVGWGPLSDSAVLAHINFDQHTRFLHYRYKELPIAPIELVTHAANLHLIPADALVEKQVKALRRGQVVNLEGYLVNARRSDGAAMNTSLSRTDTGAGACEIVYVTQVSAR